MRRVLAAALALALAATAPAAQAQDSRPGAARVQIPPAAAAQWGKALERDLAARGVRVAIVFRAGRPQSQMPPGMAYTHGAFWVYRTITAEDGRRLSGYAVYNLYQGDGRTLPVNRSRLTQDWPTDFITPSSEPVVAVIVPTPEMQRRLLALIDFPAYAALHNPSYSLVDNPFDDRHQSCTTFILTVVASAAWETQDRLQLASNLRAHFAPTIVRAGPLTRVFAPIFDARIATDDQQGPIRTAAYESIEGFMRANGLLADSYYFRRPGLPAGPIQASPG